jgi:hypothetical protein
MNVAKVDRDVAHVAIAIHVCCKRLFEMFHPFFQTCVASALTGFCICFHTDVASVCSNFFSISNERCKCFIWMLHMSHTDVAHVCFKCFIYFRCMLQQVFLCVASVFIFQALNGTTRVTWSTFAGGGANAIRAGTGDPRLHVGSGAEAWTPCV